MSNPGIRNLSCAAKVALFLIASSLALAAATTPSGPATYNIRFSVAYGGPAPVGSFTYDPAKGFSNFIVQWNGYSFDLTAAANKPIVIQNVASGCAGVSGAALGFAIISQQVTGCSALGNYSYILDPTLAVFQDLDQTINPSSKLGNGLAIGVSKGTPPETTVYAIGSWSITPAVGVMSQIASGAGWDTQLTLVNTSPAASQAMLSFLDNNGAALPLPLTFPQGGMTAQSASSLTETLNPDQILILDTNDTSSQAGFSGAAELTGTGIDGFAMFRYTPTGQEALVPLQPVLSDTYILPFDNTGGIVTGVAVSIASSNDTQTHVVIRDDAGAIIYSGNLPLSANGHTSFQLAQAYAATANMRGTVEFDTPSGTQLTVLGLRAAPIAGSNGSFSVTTIPVIVPSASGSGSMAQVAAGGGWKTTFTLVNTGSATAQGTLNFYDNNGAPMALPLLYPQAQTAATSSSVSISLAPGQTLTMTADDPNNSDTGSAVLTTSDAIGGYAIFEYTPTGQEAVVPVETRGSQSYLLAYDNTNGIITGIAVANLGAAQSVGVTVRDDTGAVLATGSLQLGAGGHTSFILTDNYAMTAGKRGTIEFTSSGTGNISVLGLRTEPTGVTQGAFAVTTVPPLVTTQ